MQHDVLSIQDYQVLGAIGDGGQANVYLCHKNMKLFAVKVFTSSLAKSDPFQRETQLLRVLQHPNIIKMKECFASGNIKFRDNTEVKKSTIVLEYAQKGELFEYISTCKGFKPEICKSIFLQILNVMGYLQEKGVSHRDIKLQNFLFDKNFNIKISDFGLSTMAEGVEKDFILKSRVGTEGFKAPEVDKGEYNGESIDIFALGVLLFILYVGSPPFFSTKASDKIYKNFINKNYQKFWAIHERTKAKGFFPETLKQLFNSLFSANPSERPTIESLKDNEWLNQAPATQKEVKQELSKRYERIIGQSQVKKRVLSMITLKKKFLIDESQNYQECESKQICWLETQIGSEDKDRQKICG